MIEVTTFKKNGGPLTKLISLKPDGTVHSDGSACIMSQGTAKRERFDDLATFAQRIDALHSDEAIALGALKLGLPDVVEITSKIRLQKLNGAAPPDLIARSGNHISYEAGNTALALCDYDTKGMPADVDRRIKDLGGFEKALNIICKDIENCGRVIRASTSAGLFRLDTKQPMPGSNGVHVFILVKDGEDVDRTLRVLHERCWLHGLGWMMAGAGGQLLERSIVDRMVGAPERLVFEGAPILVAPLAQNREKRRPVVIDGAPLDTAAAVPPLTILEKSKLRELKAKVMHRMAPEASKAREHFIALQALRLVECGVTEEIARHVIERQCNGVLLPDVVLPFDDAELAGMTVGDVLADPVRFEGMTLADPLEGVDYGACKAKIMRRANGSPWIHSFAHGRTTYELKHDARSVGSVLKSVEPEWLVRTFIKIALQADLEDNELEDLRNFVAQRTNVGKRTIDRSLKASRKEEIKSEAAEERSRRIAQRNDPRPEIEAPSPDAPWIPQMDLLNEVLGGSNADEPPMRDLEGYIVQVRSRSVPSMHSLTSAGTNDGDAAETRLPPPEMPLLTRLDEPQVAELIERHIDYQTPAGESVHLHSAFVKHFACRADGALPAAIAVATLPIVLPDGDILSGRGLDRQRGIVFRVPSELQNLLPDRARCTSTEVASAMRFLVDEWLADVPTSYSGKCVLISMNLTIIERLVLPERPAFFVDAGQRGVGKTTATQMVSTSVLGCRAAAAAWSPVDEERRKALFSYLGEGVPFIVWDNIPRGSAISCPAIEKTLTSESYSDRVLGVTGTRTVPSTAVQVFTGNNISARGDMCSRSLVTRLEVTRPDPENRKFKHSDPIGWTEANRGALLAAMFTILLGNPRLTEASPEQAETRFKGWWHLVGSAVENAAREHRAHVDALTVDANPDCKPEIISFKKLFLDGESNDEQASSLATVLETINRNWSSGASSNTISAYAGRADEEAIEFKTALEQASGRAIKVISAQIVSARLRAIKDAPVQVGQAVLVLKYRPEHEGGTYFVQALK